MEVVFVSFSTSLIVFNFIEWSAEFDCLPNGDPIPDVHQDVPPSSPLFPARNYPTGNTITAATTPLSMRSRTRSIRFESTPARSRSPPARSMLPPTRLPTIDGLECRIEQLRFIRLIPYANRNRIFQLREYTFPADKPLKIKVRRNVFAHMQNREQIVLCTSDGDILAFLETHDHLAGVYTYIKNVRGIRRAKINMASSTITILTRAEQEETPVGPQRSISGCFWVQNSEIHPAGNN